MCKPFAVAILLLGVASSLTGCSPDSDALYQTEKPDELAGKALFSAADRTAAQALSPFNNPLINTANTLYSRALMCHFGLEQLVLKAQSLAEISDEQRRALDQASRYFKKYLDNNAKIENKTDDDVKRDLEAISLNHTDSGESIRLATACLRALDAGNLS